MTRYLESEIGRPGKARKRVKDLLGDAWEVRVLEDGWHIRAPMDIGIWQEWRRLDKEWAELVATDIYLDAEA
jgi:hypothetical protein